LSLSVAGWQPKRAGGKGGLKSFKEKCSLPSGTILSSGGVTAGKEIPRSFLELYKNVGHAFDLSQQFTWRGRSYRDFCAT